MSNTKDAIIGLLHSSLRDRDDRVAILRTIIKDNDATILELDKTLEERDTIYATDLKKELAIRDTIISDLHKAIKKQRDALNELRGVAVDN